MTKLTILLSRIVEALYCCTDISVKTKEECLDALRQLIKENNEQ